MVTPHPPEPSRKHCTRPEPDNSPPTIPSHQSSASTPPLKTGDLPNICNDETLPLDARVASPPKRIQPSRRHSAQGRPYQPTQGPSLCPLMSGNRSQQPRQSAGDLVRSILDDRPAEEISPSGELYSVLEQRLELEPTGHYLSTSPTASTTLYQRFSREPSAPIPLGAQPGVLALPSGVAWPHRRAQPPPPLPPLRNYTPQAASYRGTSLADLRRAVRRSHSVRPGTAWDFNRAGGGNRTSSPPLMPPPVHAQDPVEDSRRAKRRKLDSDRNPPAFKGFRYGRFGQVEPGQLTMEIVSCDGGIFEGTTSCGAGNILKDDSSVYCTRTSTCNIVLQHQGSTVFSLKELVIKAPAHSYSSPVREGMVFISMNKDELLTRTALYQMQYEVARNQDGDRGPPIFSVRHSDDGITTRISGRRRTHSILEQEEVRTAQIPSELTVTPPPFRVTTECEDEAEDAHVRLTSRRRTPNRIGSLPFESDSSDDWAPIDDSFDDVYEYGQHNSRRRETTGRTSLEQAVEASQLATQEAVRAVGGKMLVPHARFYIEKGKSKCTIRFDPPVSGRFILLKMWNPKLEAGNIDIQGVVAKGFAGPRYFPSVELL